MAEWNGANGPAGGGRARTGIADGEAGEFASGAVKVGAAIDEDLDEASGTDGLVEVRVVAAQVADEVAGARAHLPLPMLQQRPHVLHQPRLVMSRDDPDDYLYNDLFEGIKKKIHALVERPDDYPGTLYFLSRAVGIFQHERRLQCVRNQASFNTTMN